MPTADEIAGAIRLLVSAGYSEAGIVNSGPSIRRRTTDIAAFRARIGEIELLNSRSGDHPFLLKSVQREALRLLTEKGPLQRSRSWNQKALIAALTTYTLEKWPNADVGDPTACRRAVKKIYELWQNQQ
jgi:arginine/ornithine N-succinyltransferase beta subunit